MSNPEIRLYGVVRGRDKSITAATICNGRLHWNVRQGLQVFGNADTVCDSKSCQGSSSEVLDISLLTIDSQDELGLRAQVPLGLVLVTKPSTFYGSHYKNRVFAGGDTVTPKQLEIGTLISDGEGTTYRLHDSWNHQDYIYYIRNIQGNAEVVKAGRVGRKRTEKRLAKLRQGERKSEVSYEVSLLNSRMQELMQLHRTPEVTEEIENVKDLLRLASSLSVEASIEAVEGNEQIARELANARAREIGAELQQARERLMFEKQVRDEVRKELGDR